MASQALIKEFEQLLGKENVFSSEADCQSYSYDSAVLNPVVPAFVVRPTTTEQLGQCVSKLYENGIPMTVRGAGTNLSGGTIPDRSDTVVILTNGLNRILEINESDLYAVVECGVVTADFANAVAAKNLLYPPDPGSQSVSTIGGNIAENAGGLRRLKYGVTKDYLMGIEFFDATGALVKSGSRTVKCVTGYNLGGMMIQSEGTLGVISTAVLQACAARPRLPRPSWPYSTTFRKPPKPWRASSPRTLSPARWNFSTTTPLSAWTTSPGPVCPATPPPSCSSRWTATPLRLRMRPSWWKRYSRKTAPSPCMWPGTRRKRTNCGKPAAWLCRAGPLQAHHRAGRRHRAALTDSGHDEGNQ